MNAAEFQRELSAFDEKVALAELEVAKAEERVRELKYQKARFGLDYMNLVVRAQQQQGAQQNAGGSQQS